MADGRYRAKGEGIATGLGWLSIGLGLSALGAPRAVGRLIGAADTKTTRALVRAVGLRELASGVAVLTQHRPSAPLWARAAGDAIDLALLGAAATSARSDKGRLAGAALAVAGIAALDVWAGANVSVDHRLVLPRARSHAPIHVRHAITIRRRPEEVYAFFRDFENLPRFMRHLEEVRALEDGRSRWTTRAPLGSSVTWEAILVEDRENELIAWRSIEGSQIETSGRVLFTPAPGGRGTEVRVELSYAPPAGRIGDTVAKLFRESPGAQLKDDLRRFKQVMETGVITESDASVRRGRHPGRPEERAHRVD